MARGPEDLEPLLVLERTRHFENNHALGIGKEVGGLIRQSQGKTRELLSSEIHQYLVARPPQNSL